MLKLLQSNLLKLFTLALLLLSVNVTWAQKTYRLVTSTSDLVAGSKYIVVSSQTAGSAAILGYQNSNNRPQGTTNVTVTNVSGVMTIVTTPATSSSDMVKGFELTLGGATGSWTFSDPITGGYLYAASSSSNYLRTQATNNTNGEWTIGFSSGSASIVANGSSANKYLRYNSPSSLFSCYSSASQSNIYLFKEASSTFTVGYNGNSNTGGSVPTDGTAYAPDATVTVLGNTGSLVRTGYTFEGWNTTSTGSGTSYVATNTFTISANTTLYAKWLAQTLTPSSTALTGFAYVEGAGPSASQQVYLTGTNLTAGGSITISGSTAYEFSSDNANFGTSATLTYTGTSLSSTPFYVRLKSALAAGSYNNQTISISGGGATSSLTASGTVSSNNAAPTATNVTVTGTYKVGQVLTGSFTYADAEGNTQGSSIYKWYRANDAAGTGSALITSSTSSTSYTLVAADNTKYIRLAVIPVATTGTTTGTETNGAWAGPVVTPTLTATPTSLSSFTYVNGNGPSAAQSFTVSGSNFGTATGTITITGSTAYEVSLSNAVNAVFTSPITISYVDNTLAATTVYVRLKSGLASGNYNNQSITVSGGGATNAVVTASGNVTVPAPVNDLCSAATNLVVNATATTGTLAGSTNTVLTGTDAGATKKDVWYVITPSCTATHTIKVSGFTGDIDTFLYTSSCPSAYAGFAASAETISSTETITASLTSGGTYYLRVIAYGTTAESTTFSVVANSVSVAPTVTNTGYSNVTYTGATISGTATVAACSAALSGYGIYYSTTSFADGAGTQAQSTNISNGTFSVSLTGLTHGTTYYYKTYATNTAGTSYSAQGSFTTPAYTVAAPVATLANPVTPSSFTANWNSVSTASDYRIDVATTNVFGGTPINEDFSTFVAGAPSTNVANSNYSNYANYFNTTGWTGANVFDADPGFSRIGTGGNPGNLTSPPVDLSVNGGTSTLTFDVKRYSTDALATIQVLIAPNGSNTFTQIGDNIALTPGINFVTKTITITGGTANSRIRIQNTEGDQRFHLDNIKVAYTTILPAYNNLTVAELIKLVPSLPENTTYYYRVRAVNSTYNVTSANSNVIPVTTGRTLTWTGSQWTNGVTPTIADYGTIAAAYTTPAAGLNIGNLTVNSDATVNVPAHTTLTVAGNLVNNAPAANFTVQDNGALVQTGNGSATGDVTVYKINNPLFRLDYTIWSAPVKNQLLRTFSSGTSSNRFYEYKYALNSANNWVEGYWSVDPDETFFDAAKGYLIRMPNSNAAAGYAAGTQAIVFTGEFKGEPHTGTQSVTLSQQANRFTAVGNPYASPISVMEFFMQNTDVLDQAGALYLWRKRNDADLGSSYAKLTRAGYVANNASVTNGVSTGGQDQASFFSGEESTFRLAPGQGFIVQTKENATSNQLVFTNSMRKAAPTTGGQAFLKSAQSTTSRIWVNLEGTNGGFSQSAIAYLNDATLGLDYGYDGKQLTNAGTVSLYTIAQNTALAIQARPAFETSDVVPVGYNANAAGEFKISLDHTDGLFAAGQNVYIKDKAMGITRNLTENDYSFTTEAGTFDDRFEIVYTTTALGTDNPVITPDHVMVYKNNQDINITAGNVLINSVAVFDIRGRKLFSQEGINAGNTVVSGLTAQNQVLIVTVATEKGSVSKKIIF